MRDMEEKTVLVVEDHSEHYKRYAALLSGMGLRVERACDGIGEKGARIIALDIVAKSRYTNIDWWRNGG